MKNLKCCKCNNLEGNCSIIRKYIDRKDFTLTMFMQMTKSEMYCSKFSERSEFYSIEELTKIYKKLIVKEK